MAYHPVDAVNPPSVASRETEEIGGLQAEAAVALTSSGDYVRSTSTHLDGFPQIEFEDTENFSPSGLIHIAANAEASDHLPSVEAPKEDGGLFAVVGDIIGGAADQLFNHTGDVIMVLATGVVVSAAIGVAAFAAAPLLLSAPAWVPIAGGITLVAAGLGVTGWALSEHAPQWLKDGEIVWNSSKYTPEEVAAAHEGLNGFGAGFVDFAAGLVGGGWMYKQMAKKTVEVAGKALSIEGKIIEGEYRVIDETRLLPGPAKSSAGDEVAAATVRKPKAVIIEPEPEAPAAAPRKPKAVIIEPEPEAPATAPRKPRAWVIEPEPKVPPAAPRKPRAWVIEPDSTSS